MMRMECSDGIPSSNQDDGVSSEMGYLFLEGSTLSVLGDREFEFPIGQWIDVEVLQGETETGFQEEDLPDDTTEQGCSRCNLQLQADGSGNLNLDLQDISRFDGRMVDASCSGCQNRMRSDAALMMGLITGCHGEVTVQRLSVLFKDNMYTRAAIAVNVGFPYLLWDEPGDRSVRRIQGRKRFGKPLYPGLQALLSIIESDWGILDTAMQSMSADSIAAKQDDTADVRDQQNSVFPSSMSLEELYLRIRGSSRTEKVFDHQRDAQLLVQPSDCHLVRLPLDVLVEKLGPFLQARSLDALRCTCASLHAALRTVVPGLKLRLYSHQISSLTWMRTRESRPILESDCFGRAAVTGTQSFCGDLHRAVTGGQSVLLSSRPKNGRPSVDVRVSQSTGYELNLEDLRNIPRHVARGGLLCDDPGLGKTITVLSLILQTVGLSTESVSEELVTKVESPPDVEEVFSAYWRERMTRDFRRPTLLKLLNQLVRTHRLDHNFPADRLRKAVGADRYEAAFGLFQSDVESGLLEAYAKDEQDIARSLVEKFQALVSIFKLGQVQSAKRKFSKASSEVAALLEAQAQHKFAQSLIPSSATLLVIPAVLMEHWQTQIDMHIDFRYCTDRQPLIFDYNRHDKDGVAFDRAITLCRVKKTHSPMVFLDKAGTRPLPPASFLSMFQFVITTTSRFMNEWKNGSFQQELDRSEVGDNIPTYSSFAVSDAACPLLKVHWLRMVVDEGHSMGKDKENSTIQFASWISAERRWAMSGTPTKQSSAQIGQLRGLMRFLQHDFFTPRLEGDIAWRNNIRRCWKDGHVAALFRLRSLLGFLMKRHTKLDIGELPPPRYRTQILPMSATEVATYNTLVSGIQSNILLTSMAGKTSGEQDSLLHRSQAKFARQALSNVRRVCVGWSRVIPTLSDKYWAEFIDLLQNHHQFEEETVNELRQFAHRTETEGLTRCHACEMQLSVLLVQPCCGGLICTECMDNDTASCYLCDDPFDIDDLQRLQPGFVLEWKSNLKHPKEIADTQENSSAAIPPPALPERDLAMGDHLRPPDELRGTKKYGDGHECRYDPVARDGHCFLCSKEHEPCNLTNKHSRCETCHRLAADCPEEESKSSYLVTKILELHRSQKDQDVGSQSPGEYQIPDGPRPLKVIIFSQFRPALNVVGDRLLKRFGTASVAEYWGRFRTQELHRFVFERDCFCMLLGKDGSEGLDLSFVTHIYFLEEIWDKSLQDQAVARAWRMGAKGRVEVETLVAKNSVEETMQELESANSHHTTGNQDASRYSVSIASNRTEYQRTKIQTLLRTLRLNTDYHRFGQTSEAKVTTELNAELIARRNEPDLSEGAEPPAKKAKTISRVRFK